MIELKKQDCLKKYINETYKTKFQLKLSVSAPPLMLESVLKGHEQISKIRKQADEISEIRMMKIKNRVRFMCVLIK